MNFLQICQRVREKTGITGTTATPTTTIGQVGELGRLVHWVNEAWEEIQNMQDSWMWMRDSFTFQTVVSTEAYTPATAGLTAFREWRPETLRCYLTASGVSDMQWMLGWDYPMFRDYYEFGAISQQTGRPMYFAIRPKDKALLLGPPPDAVYTITGEYQKSATLMALDADIPEMPTQYHMLIVHAALMKYASYENAPEVMMMASRDYSNAMMRLCQDQLDKLTFGPPLA